MPLGRALSLGSGLCDSCLLDGSGVTGTWAMASAGGILAIVTIDQYLVYENNYHPFCTYNSTALLGLYSFSHYITWALILRTPIWKKGGRCKGTALVTQPLFISDT